MKYVFTRKVEPLTEIFAFKTEKRYKPDKDGQVMAVVDTIGTLSEKEKQWYLKNYMNVWCFFH